jgi:hypothetical protein
VVDEQQRPLGIVSLGDLAAADGVAQVALSGIVQAPPNQ